MQAPVVVLNTNTKRETGREAQLSNIMAAKTVADVIRTCLGPKSMLKMVLDPMGGIALTNDGNAILREIDVTHPAAKSMIELSRAQDENVGDGTTSVVILAGEALQLAEACLQRNMHPTIIIGAYFKAIEDAVAALEKVSIKVDLQDRKQTLGVIASCIGTKFIGQWSDLMCSLALDAVSIVKMDITGGPKERPSDIDLKKYARIEKIPGGDVTDCKVIRGVVVNKDVTHCKMRRRIVNPRIVLLDCNLEYKKGESQTNVECMNPDDFAKLLKLEEESIAQMCNHIIKFKPDLVCTQKGVSDLAQHYLMKAGITALRRMKITDNNRLARVSGATVVHRPEELQESDIGTDCGLFEVQKIGDEYYSFITESKNPKACTILLRGANKDVLNEVERNLWDAMSVARNIVLEPRLVPGGGAAEMAVAQVLTQKAKSIQGVRQVPYKNIAIALEVIPRTLAQNCGADVVRLLTELRAKHAQDPEKNWSWGIDGIKGCISDMHQVGIWEPFEVKAQTIKAAIESACILLRVDDVVSGTKTKQGGGQMGGEPDEKAMEEAEMREQAE